MNILSGDANANQENEILVDLCEGKSASESLNTPTGDNRDGDLARQAILALNLNLTWVQATLLTTTASSTFKEIFDVDSDLRQYNVMRACTV